ncbi:hypothetical protein SAMN05720470_11210 [Fibrobacter sp. UWOV1]|nr:hypothetical protein SAMN05720470_11210 [Fibrobacter sp. UWOV1]
MTPQQFTKIFWKQYLLLEKDFLEMGVFWIIKFCKNGKA